MNGSLPAGLAERTLPLGITWQDRDGAYRLLLFWRTEEARRFFPSPVPLQFSLWSCTREDSAPGTYTADQFRGRIRAVASVDAYPLLRPKGAPLPAWVERGWVEILSPRGMPDPLGFPRLLVVHNRAYPGFSFAFSGTDIEYIRQRDRLLDGRGNDFFAVYQQRLYRHV